MKRWCFPTARERRGIKGRTDRSKCGEGIPLKHPSMEKINVNGEVRRTLAKEIIPGGPNPTKEKQEKEK